MSPVQNSGVVHMSIFNCEFHRQLGSFSKHRACLSSSRTKMMPRSKQASRIRNGIITLVACRRNTEEVCGLEVFWKEHIKLETGPLQSVTWL